MIKIVVTGGRDYFNRLRVYTELDKLHKEKTIASVLSGAARGADTLCDDWATTRGIDRIIMPANWGRDKKAAGPLRNIRMAETKPDLCVAFPGGRGTEHMKQTCRRFGIEVLEIK